MIRGSIPRSRLKWRPACRQPLPTRSPYCCEWITTRATVWALREHNTTWSSPTKCHFSYGRRETPNFNPDVHKEDSVKLANAVCILLLLLGMPSLQAADSKTDEAAIRAAIARGHVKATDDEIVWSGAYERPFVRPNKGE